MQRILDLLELYGLAIGDEYTHLRIYQDFSGEVVHSKALDERPCFEFDGEEDLINRLKDGIKHEAA